MSNEKYPPRTLVGRYFSEQFQSLCQRGNIAVTHVPSAVRCIERQESNWVVRGAFDSQQYDEVLLATGHGLADALPAEPLAGALNSMPLIGDYTSLIQTEILPGSSVWIRGAALTAYDVALLLTEARGGTWQASGEDGADERYLSSGEEPRRITLASRSGILMDPKPETIPIEITACLAKYQQRLRQWGAMVRNEMLDGVPNLSGMWVVLLNCAEECALIMASSITALALWRTALTGLSVAADHYGAPAWLSGNPTTRLRHSILVNQGQAPVTTGWIWARVWSGLYGELIVAMNRLPPNTVQSPQFRQVARNLEKFAFGPPELTARKLLALCDAGILHVAHPGETPAPDAVLIDAVTPGPGVLLRAAPDGCATSDLAAGMLETGDLTVRAGERGLLTELDGTCVRSDGSRNETLAAVGRPTEDPTLGHDTLNRHLHKEPRLWAERIAARANDQIDP